MGAFTLDQRIALGGMAEIWRAYGPRGDRGEGVLALKVMRPSVANDPEFYDRFVDEVRISRRLRHENIIEVYEGHEFEHHLVQSMELLDGADLRKLARRLEEKRVRYPIALALQIARCTAKALAYAHLKKNSKGEPLGIVHRDLSPHNVMVTFDGRVKVLDFGIAKAKERLIKTQGNIAKGKTSYMSPEQVVAQELDGRTDVFAAGVILWEMLAGQRLFQGSNEVDSMKQVRDRKEPRIESARSEVPNSVATLLHSMLVKNKQRRCGSMLEVESELNRILACEFHTAEYSKQALAHWIGQLRKKRVEGTAVLTPASTIDDSDTETPEADIM